jgi:DNA-binding CsgD family transcriptional regulator
VTFTEVPTQELSEELLDSLYAAVADPAAWQEFLALLASSLGAPWAAFLVPSSTAQLAIAINVNLPQEVLRPYDEYYHKVDPWHAGFRERGGADWVGLGRELCPVARFDQGEFYNEWWKAIRFPARSQAGIIHTSSGIPWVLSLLRDERQTEFGEEHADYLRRLYPHLRRALSLHRKVLELKHSVAAAGGVVDALDVGLIGVDARGKICFANSLAEAELREGDLLTNRDGQLAARDETGGRALKSLLRSASGQSGVHGSCATLTLRGETRSLHLAALPATNYGGVISGKPAVFLTLTDPDAAPGNRAQVLASIFALTPAEIRVVMLLMAGSDAPRIAEQTGATADSVRFQLKMIYRKTGVTKQSQLVRLISRLPGLP